MVHIALLQQKYSIGMLYLLKFRCIQQHTYSQVVHLHKNIDHLSLTQVSKHVVSIGMDWIDDSSITPVQP